MDIHPEVFLAAGYAIFLLGVSIALDLLARHSHNRTERYRTAGFTYHHKSDAWICPEGQHLTRSEVDLERRLIRYRGRPLICNHCPTKTDCTDSDEGREVVRAIDPWPHSEAGRFHRGISLVVALIAALILTAEAIHNHAPLELVIFGVVLVAIAFVAWHLHAAFRARPPSFPVPRASLPSHTPVKPIQLDHRKSKEPRRRA